MRQLLEKHLTNVAELAAQFAAPFHQEDSAAYIGWAHDLGKLKATWQERLLQLEAGGTPAFDELKHDHKMASAALVYAHSKTAALVIAGHHGGLPDLDKFVAAIESGKWNASRNEIIERVGTPNLPKRGGLPGSQFFQLLMLYSCLVDADSIDTSAHFENRLATPEFSALSELHSKLLAAEVPKTASAEVRGMRSAVRAACLDKAASGKGFFSLHAPTGTGKTISGGLFATGHAALHGLSRIVYVAPYRTIIDQTAEVYSSLFGEENVLPHHSTADFWSTGETGRLQRQLAENWDSPVIVTTSEQFFESIYSGRPGASRKLHNLVNSVIVVDEPQALPVRLLTPCLAALKALVEQFGCSVVFMSATVPPLNHEGLLGRGTVVNNVLRSDFKAVQRVTVDIDKFRSCYWSDISAFMSQHHQALAIANTRKGALRVYSSLPRESRTYLSTWLCPAHRKLVVASIKHKLTNGEGCHVASTQVIEAGVDLDFPDVLLREKAPLDSLLQAFGRCNRNGNGSGQCYVFSPAEGNQLPDYAKAIACVNELLYEKRLDAFAADTLNRYFEMLYGESNLDKRQIMKHVAALNFETVRYGNEETGEGGFRLIASNQLHLVVEYGTREQREGLQKAIEAINTKIAEDVVPPRWATRRLQNFVVSLYPGTFNKLDQAFPLAMSHLFLNYFVWKGEYSDRTGLGDVVESMTDSSDEE